MNMNSIPCPFSIHYTGMRNTPGLRIFVAILVAAACGSAIGFCTAEVHFRQHPWTGGPRAAHSTSETWASVNEDEFDFGKRDTSENGEHEFTVTNRGDRTLTLNHGHSSCSCTVSEIKEGRLAPGQSTKVAVSWRSKGHVGPFQQSVTIVTNDPLRPEITLSIKGEYTARCMLSPMN